MARPPIFPDDDELFYGIVIAAYPAVNTASIEIQRKSTRANNTTFRSVRTFVPQTGGQPVVFKDNLPPSTFTYTYRGRHVAEGFTNGAWSSNLALKPSVIMDKSPPLAEEGRRRIDSVWAGDQILLGKVSQTEGGAALSMVTGHQSGSVNGGHSSSGSTAWTDGPQTTFSPTFGSIPVVKLFPEDGTVYHQPSSKAWSSGFSSTKSQHVELKAVNITSSGFTPRARLVIRGGNPTAVSRNMAGTAVLDNTESTSQTLGSSGPAHNDQYTVKYDLDMTLDTPTTLPQTVTATVAIDSATAATFTERGSVSYTTSLNSTSSTNSWNNETQVVSVTNAATTTRIRLRFKSLSVVPGSTADLTVKVDGSSVGGITWSKTAAGSHFTEMCETTADTVTWIAYSAQTTT